MNAVALARAARAALAEHADPARGGAQQAYMKSAMPCRGVPMPLMRTLMRAIIASHPLPDAGSWREAVLDLFDGAEFREERYAALTIARAPRYRAFADRLESLALYEHLCRVGAWWDLVDETAHLVGGVLTAHPEQSAIVLRQWARDPDVWIRRVAILSQLDRKASTDTALLADCIEPSLDDADFFARKAIGWALRQYARTDLGWVVSITDRWGERLSPLSCREALKHLA